MDAKLANTDQGLDGFLHWDFLVKTVGSDTVVPIIYGGEEIGQQAAALAFTNTGSIEQLPIVGAPWIDALVRNTPFATVDSAIRTQLSDNGYGNYSPKYDIKNELLLVSIIKVGN